MGFLDFITRKEETIQEKTENINGYEVGIKSRVIYHCPKGLTEYHLPEGTKGLQMSACSDMQPTIEKLIVPRSFLGFTRKEIQYVGQSALTIAKNLKEIYFSDGIKDIEHTNLFNTACVTFNVPESVPHRRHFIYVPSEDGKLVIGDNVTSIDIGFASHDLRLKEVIISGRVKTIPMEAFNQCKCIKRVVLNQGVEKCGARAFLGTNDLEYVELPESFQGLFEAPMEKRGGKIELAGKLYSYAGGQYDEKKQVILNISIAYLGKKYSFQIHRGDFENLYLQKNRLLYNNNQISCDLNELDPNFVYAVGDGKISRKPQTKQRGMRNQIHYEPSPTKTEPSPRGSIKDNPSWVLDCDLYSLEQINDVIYYLIGQSTLEIKQGFDSVSTLQKENLSYENFLSLAIALHIRGQLLSKKGPNYRYSVEATKQAEEYLKEEIIDKLSPNEEMSERDILMGFYNLVEMVKKDRETK